MRLFVAVKIPDEVRQSLEHFCREIKASTALPKKVKWARPENLHLTLKFFGEIEESRLEELLTALSRSMGNREPFSATARGIGVFPENAPPRVLWAGVDDPEEGLKKLAGSIEQETVLAGFPPSDKPFSAHLTLARFPTVPGAGIKDEVLKRENSVFGEIRVRAVSLIQSRLEASGPVYADLKEFFLHDR